MSYARAAFFLGLCLAAVAQECDKDTPDQAQGSMMLSTRSTDKKAADLAEESSAGTSAAATTFTMELYESVARADAGADAATASDPCTDTSNATHNRVISASGADAGLVLICNAGSEPASPGNYTCTGEIKPGRLLETTCAPTAPGAGLLEAASDGKKWGYGYGSRGYGSRGYASWRFFGYWR
mmetsp:Transcript_87782/g.196198  ORF Transcript_87782/g.196198 Transcript_87782/m.196198 type:complete len:183 (-) Transcript_87782:55-603(-)